MSNRDFYRDLQPFHSFVDEVFRPDCYRPLPHDWLLLVADIAGSTRAVEAGRYEEVNYLGAACIVAINNAMKGISVPTVFGGDGATAAVPPEARDTAVGALLATQRWGRASFGLDLRVGAVPMGELARRGAVVEVAKLEFSPGNAMAMFRGNGFDVADRLVKDDDGSAGFRVHGEDDDSAPDLTDLSCRWAPLPSENGAMLCLIVQALASGVPEADDIYREVLERVGGIVELNSAAASPVKLTNLHSRLRLSAMRKEVASRGGNPWRCWAEVALRHVAQVITFRLGLKPGGFDPQRYQHEVTINADFRKVNGMLRLILDCRIEQCDAIESRLTAMQDAGRIRFGAHRATHAIMTCVTPNVDNNEHVHFIDGGAGGLYSAAKQLKQRIALEADPPATHATGSG